MFRGVAGLQPTGIVVGFPRTGTSMMMECLMLGGMEVCYTRHPWGSQVGHETYELDAKTQQDGAFPGGTEYRGKVVKLNPLMWDKLRHRDYYTIYMTRNYAAQRNSAIATGQGVPGESMAEYNEINRYHMRKFERQSIRFVQFDYRDVLSDPLNAMRCLQDAGWPIQPHGAARGVKPYMVTYL